MNLNDLPENFHVLFFSVDKRWKCVVQNWNYPPKKCYKKWDAIEDTPEQAYQSAMSKMKEEENKSVEIKRHESTILKKTNFSSLFGD